MIDDKGLSLLYGEITGESSEKNESRNKTVKLANVATPRNEKVLPIDVPELSFIGLDDIEAHTMKQLGSKVASGLKSSAKRFYKGDLLGTSENLSLLLSFSENDSKTQKNS